MFLCLKLKKKRSTQSRIVCQLMYRRRSLPFGKMPYLNRKKVSSHNANCCNRTRSMSRKPCLKLMNFLLKIKAERLTQPRICKPLMNNLKTTKMCLDTSRSTKTTNSSRHVSTLVSITTKRKKFDILKRRRSQLRNTSGLFRRRQD